MLDRFEQYGIRLRMNKCSFMKTSVEYLGHVIDASGLHTSQTKIEAVLKMPVPNNIHQLRSYLGLINYYGKFIKNMSEICSPFYELLKTDVRFSWNKECEKSFNTIKKMLSSSPVLCHYNEDMKLGLACDASAIGIGAVLFHILPDGTEKPISYASKTLSRSEARYSQIEKEALSIIFGLKKFHQYVYGRKFSLVTDHKPLLTIFNPHKGINSTAANRIQRWALLLAGYDYDINYNFTRHPKLMPMQIHFLGYQ